MATDLHLTGNELIVFAVIHGYTVSCGSYKGGMEMLGKWCDDVPHSDSAEYKMWGNGMALPCVLYVIEGIEEVLKNNQ